MRLRSRWTPIGVAALAALVVAGCGSSSSSSKKAGASTAPATTTSQTAGTPKKGGTLTVLEVAGGVDNLDPAYWYYQTDYSDLFRPTQQSLYSFTSQGQVALPDIATAMPVISNGGKTYTIHIRPGVYYSPPLQHQQVVADDFRYAFQRCFLANAGSDNYSGSYYNNIVGAPAGHVKSLPALAGVQAPNPTTLVINTTQPVGVLASAQALSMGCNVPVPRAYAAKYDVGAQSAYGMHQVFTGPYMIQGAGTGTVPSSSYSPGKTLILARNPSWNPATDPFVKAYLNQIVFKGGNDITVASRQVLNGSDLISGDFAAPPTTILQQGLTTQKSQFSVLPSGGNRYITLNNTVKPLDNVNFRRAIAAVLNKNELRLTRGGPALGTVATHFIPPGTSGYEQAGAAAGPGFDFLANPNGSLAVAEKYMKLAGYPSGKYTGPPLLTVADTQPPASNTALAFQNQLAQIGIKLTLRQVPHATMLSKFCEVTAAKVAICPNTGWGRDFPDAQSMIAPVFSAAALGPVTANMSQTNDPVLNKEINTAIGFLSPAQRAAAWGNMDKYVTQQAFVVPWLWDNDVTFASKDVHIVTWSYANNSQDFGNISLTNA